MADNPGKLPPPQGAKILFDTDWDSERDSFNTLGMTATRISANIFLRNERDKHPAIAAIYGLTRNAKLESPLFKRVGWNQRMAIGEIFTALLVVNVAAVLNRPPKVSTSANDGKKGMSALDKIAEDVGLQQFKDNVDTFFEVLDDVWGIRAIHYTQLATHIKRNFMIALAHVFATHTEFWHGKRLFVSSDIRGRLKSFPTTDPTVSQLSRSGSSVRPMLVSMIIEHLNKNKSANKLVLKDIPLGKEMKGKGKSKSNGMAAQHADLS
jgi:hypothetical protein